MRVENTPQTCSRVSGMSVLEPMKTDLLISQAMYPVMGNSCIRVRLVKRAQAAGETLETLHPMFTTIQ